MSHRSDVAYIIAGETTDIVAFLVKCRINHPEVKAAIDECTVGQLSAEVMYIGFQAKNTKWYPDYPDVACHEALWALALEESVLDGQKCIIGEDETDLSSVDFGHGYFELYEHLSIDRSLSVDFGIAPGDDVRENLKELLCQSPNSL